MLIVHVIATNFVGGPEKQILTHLVQLEKLGHSVVLISYQEQGGKSLYDFALKHGIDCRLIPAEKRKMLSALFGLKEIIKSTKADIVCAHGFKSCFLMVLLRYWIGCKFIAFSRGWTTENLKVRLYNLIDKIFVRRANKIVAVSRSQGILLKQSGINADKIKVIENCETLSTLEGEDQSTKKSIIKELGLAEDSKLILVAGRLSPEKNPLNALRAFIDGVSEKVPCAHLVFAGDGPLRNELEDLTNKSSCKDRVHYLGFRTDIYNIIKHSYLVAIPSMSEGMPNILIESMVLGFPVVATKVGGIPDVITNEESGMLVESNDSNELADAMSKVLLEEDTAKKLVRNANDLISKRFDATKQTSTLLSLYESVINE